MGRAFVARLPSKVAGIAVILTLSVAATAAAADEPASGCSSALGQFKTRRDASDLVGAKESLSHCDASCSAQEHTDCAMELTLLDARMPTVVVVARDQFGRDIAGVRLFLDGAPWPGAVDRREREINPGPHRIRAEVNGAAPVEQEFEASEHEKGRSIEFGLDVAPPPPVLVEPAPAPSPRVAAPTSSIVLAGVGVVGLGTSAILGLSGLSARDDASTCRPYCSEHQVDTVNRRFIAADMALGVAVVSLAAAAIIFFTRAEDTRPRPPLRDGFESARR